MLKVEHITKRYHDKTVVRDISFALETGHICGFVGPNGAGKSTTMNIITGYLQPTSGSVSIGEIDIRKKPDEYRRLFGYLPEIPPLYPDMLVEDYLRFVHEAKGLDKQKRSEQVAEAMEMADVTHVRGRLIKNLSKGYKQRVGMAQAFLGRPPLIILDEPTIGLDPAQIVQVRNILLSLKEQHTVLLSSHILSEIGEVCDEIVLINRGELVAADTEKELVSAHTDAARYLIRAEDGMLALAENAARELCPEVRCGRADAETLELAFPKEKDPGLQLTDRLIEGGVRFGELYRKTRSLEDVFLELVNAADGNDGGRA